MTMITPERAAATNAANRLLELKMSHSDVSVSDNRRLEEKKTEDSEDYIALFKAQLAMEMEMPSFFAAHSQPVFRNTISNAPGSKFLPQKGRYVLYVSRACPESHRALLIRTIKGLEDVISVKYMQLQSTSTGNRSWVISHEIPDDSLASFKSDEGEFTNLRDIYNKEGDTTNNNNTIPLLYDQEHECIVNNDADDIAWMLNSSFSDFCQHAPFDLLPRLSPMKEELQQWLYPLLQLTPSNLPPFRYDLSARDLEYAFDRATRILQKQRYLLSHTDLTDADLRLFVVLVRYDAVYSKYLTSPPLLLHNPALLDYCRDIYQLPGVADTIRMDEIRAHFLGTTSPPRTLDNIRNQQNDALVELLEVPHRRERL